MSTNSGDLPAPGPARARTSVGVTVVERPTEVQEPTRGLRSAGERSDLFLAGGAAFEAWCVVTKGLHPNARLTEQELQPLLVEFASRPVHGHRRGPTGGDHRPNRR